MPSFNPDLFKLAREEKGLSQKALAEQLGVAQSEISKVESGKKDRKSTRLNSSHIQKSRMPSSA